jgi:hypothetical protein
MPSKHTHSLVAQVKEGRQALAARAEAGHRGALPAQGEAQLPARAVRWWGARGREVGHLHVSCVKRGPGVSAAYLLVILLDSACLQGVGSWFRGGVADNYHLLSPCLQKHQPLGMEPTQSNGRTPLPFLAESCGSGYLYSSACTYEGTPLKRQTAWGLTLNSA